MNPLIEGNAEKTRKGFKNLTIIPSLDSITRLYKKIVSNMQLTTESCLLSLIFIERLIVRLLNLIILFIERKWCSDSIIQLETNSVWVIGASCQILGGHPVNKFHAY